MLSYLGKIIVFLGVSETVRKFLRHFTCLVTNCY